MKRNFTIIWLGAILMLLLPVMAIAAPTDSVSDDGTIVNAQKPTEEGALLISHPSNGKGKSAREAGADMTPLTKADIERIKNLPVVTADKSIQESIVGTDTRMQVYPTYGRATRRTALITFSAGRCTGWFIGNNTVVTAGHCVHSGGSSGNWYPASSYTIYPGYTGSSAPYGSTTAKSLRSVAGWSSSGNANYDYGAIILNANLGDNVGWFGYQNLSSPANYPTIINGYPGDKPLTQWVHADKVRAYTSYQLRYKNDTYGGMSGSPVWYEAGTGPYGLAVHTYGLGSDGNNAGTRINSSVFNNFVYWAGLN